LSGLVSVCRDPDDDKLLEIAAVRRGDCLVTGADVAVGAPRTVARDIYRLKRGESPCPHDPISINMDLRVRALRAWRPFGRLNMKTTVELPDDLYRKAKSQAALHGRRLRDLVEEGLRLVLSERRRRNSQPSLAELMKNAIGVVDSGVPDLGSNPKHLADFGRDVRRHR